MTLRFGVLGTVEVWRDEAQLALARPRHRAFLGLLLLHVGRTVSVGQITEAIWGGAPPGTAKAQIQAWVSALRRALGAELLRTRPAGYLLDVEAEHVDVKRFETAVARARAALDPETRVKELTAALDLWRGQALVGVDAAYAEGARARLEEERLAAIEDFYDAELTLGRHTESIAGLGALVHERPLRDRLRGQLMLALHRAGRPAEALATFRQIRIMLREAHGLDPSPSLSSLAQAILRSEVAEPASPGRTQPIRRGAVRPRELSADVSDFTGRRAELALLDGFPGRGRSGSTISVITGPAGVGKTALALRWAHRIADRYPDGQLQIDLSGSADRPPMTPGDALSALLSGLGVHRSQIPRGLHAAARLYRSVLSRQAVLVVLDGAMSAEQVRPLLPGGSGCHILVTSRHRLGDLSARHGARRLALDVLTQPEAIELLARMVGRARVAAEPGAARELVTLCGRLPLEVRGAATDLVDRPEQTIRAYLDELLVGDRTGRLVVAGRRSGESAGGALCTSERPAGLVGPPGRRFRRRKTGRSGV